MNLRLRRILISFGVLVVLFIVANIAINSIIKKKVAHFLKTRTPAHIITKYEDLTLDFLDGTIKLHDAAITIKNKSDNIVNTLINVKLVIVEDVSYLDYVLHNEIHIKDIEIQFPIVRYYKDRLVSHKDSTSSKPLKLYKPLLIDDLKIHAAELSILDNTEDSLLFNSKNISLEIQDILINDAILSKRLPVSYKNYSVNADSIFLKAGDFENITINNFDLIDKKVTLKDINLKTKYSRQELGKISGTERDHFKVLIDSFNINQINFGFIGRDFFARSNHIEIFNPTASIFRDKLINDDISTKPLYSKMIRDIPFNLTIDSLNLYNSIVTYTEKIKPENDGGSINFTHLNVHITNISNTYAAPTNTEIKIDGEFMNEAQLNATWNFDVNDNNDKFIFKGAIDKLHSKTLNAFTEPNLNVNLEGNVNKTYFTISGDNNTSVVDMKISYSDFRINVLNKKGTKKNKVLSGVANLLLKNDTEKDGENFKEGQGHVSRDSTKSFFNYLWLNVKEGMLRSITGMTDKVDRHKKSENRKKTRLEKKETKREKRHEKSNKKNEK